MLSKSSSVMSVYTYIHSFTGRFKSFTQKKAFITYVCQRACVKERERKKRDRVIGRHAVEIEHNCNITYEKILMTAVV